MYKIFTVFAASICLGNTAGPAAESPIAPGAN